MLKTFIMNLYSEIQTQEVGEYIYSNLVQVQYAPNGAFLLKLGTAFNII